MVVTPNLVNLRRRPIEDPIERIDWVDISLIVKIKE